MGDIVPGGFFGELLAPWLRCCDRRVDTMQLVPRLSLVSQQVNFENLGSVHLSILSSLIITYPLVLFFLTNCWFWFLAEGYDFILNSESVRKAQKHLNSHLKFPVPPHIMRSLSLLNRRHHPLLKRCSTGLALGGMKIPIPLTTWDGAPLQFPSGLTASLRGPQVTSSKCFSWLRSIIHIISYYNELTGLSPQIVLNKNSPRIQPQNDLNTAYQLRHHAPRIRFLSKRVQIR